MDERLSSLAKEIRNAYTAGQIVPSREAVLANSAEEGYSVQAINTAYWVGEGRRHFGWKIGLTSQQAQIQLETDEPDYGVLFADMAIGHDGKLSPSTLHQPRAEAEIAFGIDAALQGDDLSVENVAAAVAWMAPAIEIVDSRFANWQVRLADTIADNASSGRFIIGKGQPLDRKRLSTQSMEMYEDGVGIAKGNATACLGNPLNALTWLARRLAGTERPLRVGDVVMSGAFAPAAVMKSGSSYRVTMPGMGDVSVNFEP